MQRVKMQSLSAGPLGIRQPGTIVEVSDDEARALIAGRHATPVETAIRRAPEAQVREAEEVETQEPSETREAEEVETRGRRSRR